MADSAGVGGAVWAPSPERISAAQLSRLMGWLAGHRQLIFGSYQDLWRWSLTDPLAFWEAMWEYFGLGPAKSFSSVFEGSMTEQRWFSGATLNYAEHALSGEREEVALICYGESGEVSRITRSELRRQVASVAETLTALGVRKGDRVAAVLPNRLEAAVGFLATASVGAVWSVCSPEFGETSVVERFAQIAPKVLIATDGYTYGGRFYEIAAKVEHIRSAIASIQAVIHVPAGKTARWQNALAWKECLSANAVPTYVPVPFDHPLWIVYTSGTTGPPKAIVHGHGGILLALNIFLGMHLDVGPKDRFLWYTSTGWVMWNILLGGLLRGATCVLYDGSPTYPDLGVLWRLAEQERVSVLGVSSAYLQECTRRGLRPRADLDLSSVKTLGSTGSPLPPSAYTWAPAAVGDDVLVASVSGGTDICSAWVASCPLLPVYPGEIQCPVLGAAVAVYNDKGQAVVDEVGELVVTQPFPSMPVRFWNDPAGKRLQESYFTTFPGVWRHGDWGRQTARGGFVIHGRSDATLNRDGIRMGTSEFYRVVEACPKIADSLVINALEGETTSELVLFVMLAPGHELTGLLAERLRAEIRTQLSPRHVPDRIIKIKDIPYTLTGKKCEIPVKRILEGATPQEVASPGALRNPGSLEQFLAHANH